MGKLLVSGGERLEGDLRIHGAKNAALPILAATLLGETESVLYDCPMISDVTYMLDALRLLGCRVKQEGNTVTVDSSNLTGNTLPEELMRKLRASITFMGALIGRLGSVQLSYPGGCAN